MGKVRWTGTREKAVIHPFKQSIPTESASIPQVATEMGRVPLSAYARILWVDSEFLRFVLSFVGTATSLLSLVLVATKVPVPSIIYALDGHSLPTLVVSGSLLRRPQHCGVPLQSETPSPCPTPCA